MKAIHDRFGYIADPHTAVGVLGWEAYKMEHAEPAQGLVLATAHPAKFADVVKKAIGSAPPLPERLAGYLKREKLRSEERRVGKECRSGWSRDHEKRR